MGEKRFCIPGLEYHDYGGEDTLFPESTKDIKQQTLDF